MATIQFRFEDRLTNKQDKLLALLNNSAVKRNVNKFIGDAITPYVPMETGRLRDSMYVGPTLISWGRGLEYAHYQYEGEVYGLNIPISSLGTIIRWTSLPGVTKYPTGRELGVPGEYRGWIFGYTTPGTQHHWTEVYETDLKRETNQKITRYLKQECKARGLNK